MRKKRDVLNDAAAVILFLVLIFGVDLAYRVRAEAGKQVPASVLDAEQTLRGQ